MQDEVWFEKFSASRECNFLIDHPIVYFCAEYAIDVDTPTYAGGLGVLAGDIIREAAEQKIPIITVGLYYHDGYICYDLYPEGILTKSSACATPQEAHLKPVVNAENKRVIVTVPIQDTLVA